MRIAIIAVIGLALLSGCTADGDREQPDGSAAVINEADLIDVRYPCNNTIACPYGQAAAAAACEAAWGSTSGKKYTINVLGGDCTATTSNSGCYSNCFMNYCQWGVTSAQKDYSGDGSVRQSNVSCTCHRQVVVHNVWCCAPPPIGPYEGWGNIGVCSDPDAGTNKTEY